MFKQNHEPPGGDLGSGSVLAARVLQASEVAKCSAMERSTAATNPPQSFLLRSWTGLLDRRHSTTSTWRHFPIFQVAIVVLSMIGSANSACGPPECAPAEGWDNFANNLGSDIAPLLALFGESVTTQYMSESSGTLDSLIFALAPLGIITAIVAAIRVAGEPILRSLIGRAKESRGTVEADLMSSTSSDVCELWNGEGVVRVLGSPVLLQLVDVSVPDSDVPGSAPKPTSGIYTFEKAVQKGMYKVKGSENPERDRDFEHFQASQNPPNLSLNVSIKPMDKGTLICFVILGVILQGGVLAYAAIDQYRLKLRKNSAAPVVYGFPIFVVGTLSLAVGMYLCSREIDISTRETTWEPTYPGTVIWLQQGGQKVGDQRFESFSRIVKSSEKSAENEITTSTKITQGTKARRVYTATAIFTSLTGFIAQFAGLRVMHSSVIVAQLGAVLIMTAVRSCAHIQRSALNDIDQPARVEGHELDWLAKKLAKCQRWEVITWPPRVVKESPPSVQAEVKEPSPNVPAVVVMANRARLAKLSADWKLEDRAKVKVLRNVIEKTINQISNSTMTMIEDDPGEFRWAVPVKTELEDGSSKVSSIELVLTRKKGESQIWSPWGTKEEELEAVLCLWISTLTHEIRVATEGNKKQLEQWRLFGPDTPETRLDYGLWVDRGTIVSTVKPWEKEARYFGRVASGDLDGSSFLCAETTQEVGLLCAQELYAVFMSELARKITDVGGITMQRVENAADESNDVEKFGLHNSNLASLATIYDDCGLGTTEEAYFSIIPAFRAVRKLPERRKASRNLEKDGQWDKATEIDLWLYNLNKSETSQRKAVVINGEIRNRLLQLTEGLVAGIVGGESSSRLRRMWGAAYLRCEKLEEASEERARSLVNLTITCEKIKPGTDLNTVFRLASTTVRELDGSKKHKTEIVESLARFALERGLLDQAETLAKYLWADTITRKEVSTSRMERNHSISKLLMDVRRKRGQVLINGELKDYLAIEASLKVAAETNVRIGVRASDIKNGVPLDFLSIRKYRTPLQMAAGAGYDKIVTTLLDARADINAEPSEFSGRTALQAAAEAGHTEIVRTLLSNAVDINAKPARHSGRTALQAAAGAGYTDIVKILLKRVSSNTNAASAKSRKHSVSQASLNPRGKASANTKSISQPVTGADHTAGILPRADVNAEPAAHSGRTALQAAAESNHIGIVELLLKEGANPDAKPAEYSGRTALQAAAGSGHERVVARLLAKANVDADPAAHSGRTALQAAAESGHIGIVELLLGGGGDVDAKPAEYSGRTALQAAAGSGHERVVVRLLSAKAKVNADPAAHLGRTALQAAAEAGHINIVELLLKEEADVKAAPAEYSGRTALQAAAGGGHELIVTLLLLADANANADPAAHSGRTALQAAAEAGHVSIVELLLKKGVNVNAEPAVHSGRTALQAASGAGHAEIIDLLLTAEAKVNAEPAVDSGRTALQAASEAGLTDIVELLLEEGADVNATPAKYSGRTALQAAAGAGNIDIVKRLLEKGAQVNAEPAEYSGRTALQAASEAGHTDILGLLLEQKSNANPVPTPSARRTAVQAEIIELLLGKGADVNATPARDSGRTALQAAAEASHVSIVKLLLEKGANVDAEPAEYSGRTALQAASGAGNIDIVERLLEKNADVNIAPARYSGLSALQAAAEAGHTDIIELLLGKGANVNAAPAPSAGRTALQAAAEAGHVSIVELLLKKSANVNAEPAEYSGRSALQAAAEAGHTKVVEVLLRFRVDVNFQPNMGLRQTALQVAAGSGRLEIVKLLLDKKADANTVPVADSGRTALQAAAGAGHTEIVNILLNRAEADVNAAPARSSGRTALQAAAEAGHTEIVNILLNDKTGAKANINAAPAYYFGRTALQAAAGAGHTEIVNILLKNSAKVDINAEPAKYSGRTALQAAVEAGHLGIVKTLLEKGANVSKPIAGIPLAAIAKRHGYDEIGELLATEIASPPPAENMKRITC